MPKLESLPQHLHQLLKSQPDGFTEHALLVLLRQTQWPEFANANFADPLSLFRAHFILFNALYRLDQQLCNSALQVKISPLAIKLETRAAGVSALIEPDPLRSYYLDITHLELTGRKEVEGLLSGAHRRLSGQQELEQALQTLELSPNQITTAEAIKTNYRRLAGQHHPDRGGSTKRLQAINQAMVVIKKQGLLN